MSLQVWLPFLGDLHNLGLSNASITAYGSPTVNNSGKIGKCYSLDGTNDYFEFSDLDINNLEQLSISFWAYSTTGNLGGLFLVRASGTHNLNISPTGLSFRDSTHSGNTALAFELPTANTWTHYSIIYNKGCWKVYKNGVEKLNLTYSSTAHLNSGLNEVRIGRALSTSGNTYFSGKINDFRIYDHALSPKEVEELTKGLVLHYKLDNNGLGGENILTNSTGFEGTTNWNGLVTADSENGHPYLIAKRTDTTSSSRTFCSHTAITSIVSSWLPGDSFTISGYYKVPSSETQETGGNMFIRWSQSSASNADADTGFTTLTTIKDVWVRFENTYTVPPNFTSSKAVYFYLSAFAAKKQATVYWKDIKLEKGNKATVWSPAKTDINYPTTYSTTIYDSSGYNNNGTIAGNLTAAAGSPRYNVATNFLTDSDKIQNVPTIVASDTLMDEFTFACWVYRDYDDATTRYIYNGIVTIALYTNFLALMTWMASDGADDNTNNTARFSPVIPYQEWTHIVFVFGDSAVKYYVNGLYQNVSNRRLYIKGYKGTGMGSNWVGKLSDLRIYTTALTAAQIKELYNTSMSIDNLGNIHARELVEI